MLFMLGQSLAAIPALPPGTTVMLVAEDLRTIYATGMVESGRLIFDRPLPPGAVLQLIIYPAPATAARAAAEASAPPPLADDEAPPAEPPLAAAPMPPAAGLSAQSVAPQSLRVRVADSGQDLVIEDAAGSVSLAAWLEGNRSLTLVLPTP